MFENVKFPFYPGDISKWLILCIFDRINSKQMFTKFHGKPHFFRNVGSWFDEWILQLLAVELK